MKVLRQKCPIILALILFSVVASNAHATLKLTLTTGSTSTEFVDTDGDGVVTTGMFLQGAFSVNITSGASFPAIGSAQSPVLDLNSFNISGGAGTITLELTDTDFTSLALLNLLTSIGGTTQGTVTWETYADSSNTEYGQGTLIASGSSNGPAFSASQNFVFNPGGTFSLTHVVTITHTGSAISSFDLITEVPEPAPLALIGMGLMILGSYRSRNKPSGIFNG